MRSLTTLAEQQSNQEFRQVIEQITKEVGAGHTLSGAIRKYPEVFSQDYADNIRQGEVNGNLDVMLQQLCGN
jgi:type IV pilus assembly protein PilC